METALYVVTSCKELTALFVDAEPAYCNFDGDFTKSRYGSYDNLLNMPVYQLDFEPYIQLAKECGAICLTLKRSMATGRFYACNVNLGGHGPRLELRPVTLEHVMDLALMKRYHENWAYELGCNIDLDATYEI